jgi:serine-type D-Ala-D-Ala carboxypeptidase (penicillin-binding protein 5/6)
MRVPSLPLRATTAFMIAAFAASGTAHAEACSSLEISERVRADFLFNLKTGEILFERNLDKTIHPASLTKMMAGVVMAQAIVEDRRLEPNTNIAYQIPSYKNFIRVALPSGRMRLDKPDVPSVRGVSVPAEDVLSLGITRSVNDAMYSMAVALDGSEEEFVVKMNSTAISLGMLSTHYTTSSGWPTPEALKTQRTNAYDQAILLRYVHGQSQQVQEFFRQPAVTFRGGTYPNTNKLFRDAYYRSVITASKTGYTCSAGRHVIMNVTLPTGEFGIGTFGHDSFRGRDERARFLISMAAHPQHTQSSAGAWDNFILKHTIPDPQKLKDNPLIFTASVQAPLHTINFRYLASVTDLDVNAAHDYLSPDTPPPSPPKLPHEERIAMWMSRSEEDHEPLDIFHAPRVL